MAVRKDGEQEWSFPHDEVKAHFASSVIIINIIHDLFFQRRLALKSEEVKTPQQMRPKGHNYREGICAHTEWGGKLQWAQEIPPSTNHLPAPCKSTLLYFQDAMGGLLPIQPRLCPQSSHSLELAAHTCVLSCLPAWRPCSHLWTTSRTHPSRMCCALPQGANRALNPQLAQLPKPDWTYSGRKRLEWIEKVWSLVPCCLVMLWWAVWRRFLFSYTVFPHVLQRKSVFLQNEGQTEVLLTQNASPHFNSHFPEKQTNTESNRRKEKKSLQLLHGPENKW